MGRVTGTGGIFMKSNDPENMRQWYEKHLGLARDRESGAVVFNWRESEDRERARSTLLLSFRTTPGISTRAVPALW